MVNPASNLRSRARGRASTTTDPEHRSDVGSRARGRASTFATDAARYEAVRRRDPLADDAFFYSVCSTGVYCRPSCGARLPLRKNIAFHQSARAAERAGFRACKRCRPAEASQRMRHQELVLTMRAQLESPDQPKTLAALASRAGMSPFYLQRLFKRHVGMTPRAYAAAHRLEQMSQQLRRGGSVTAALYEAGYSSSSRFYETSGALGVKPATLRRGSPGIALRALVAPCALGQVLIAATPRGICSIAFGDTPEALLLELAQRFPRALVHAEDDALRALGRQVIELIDSAGSAEGVPLDLIGTAFQQRVWRALCRIPRGQTTSYGELAAELGLPRAARAVGTACGQNPVAALVPCHRVLRGDGALGGYRWGLERKRKLLARERPK